MKKIILYLPLVFTFFSCSVFDGDDGPIVDYYLFHDTNTLKIFSIVKDIEAKQFGRYDSLISTNLTLKTRTKFIYNDVFDTTLIYRHSGKVSFVQILTLNLNEYSNILSKGSIDSTIKFSHRFETVGGLDHQLTTSIVNLLGNDNQKTLELIPGVIANPSAGASFRLFALRLNEKEEYLPSSEELYVEIFNPKGVLIHKSSTGMMHTTAIESVKPEQVGDFYEYRHDWFLDELMMPKNGTYGAMLFIPAKTQPYVVRVEFNWDNNGL